ncbi:hypothetical protein WJX72_010698 [[Myrmecia] bisecta]|uniref:FAD dependent oxidoreductase domain-containing protein n=1 Tax=[Myrmecia] bisecta TaxID=41462 RepID=A0AAW1Q1Q7_9CHLO
MIRSTLPPRRSGRSRQAPPGQSSHVAAIACSSQARAVQAASGRRYAVVGGGFAGVAVAWHLLAQATATAPVQVQLFDLAGLGGGGSGAAGGLLHPFSPSGKLLWRGEEAMADALQLVQAAEHAARADEGLDPSAQFVWRQPIMRPAATAKQVKQFLKVQKAKAAPPAGGPAHVSCLTAREALHLLPGLSQQPVPQPAAPLARQGRGDMKAAATAAAGQPGPAALLIKGGLVLHPVRYLRALWSACQHQAATAGGSSATLVHERVTSLALLEQQQGPFDAVIVAAGAAVATIPEIGDRVPLELCQGYTLDLAWPDPAPSVQPGMADTVPSASSSHYQASGSRGLVYHAWAGRLVAQAVLADDESMLPPELLRWKQQPR